MATYSIDLGIDVYATNGASGKSGSDAHPLQFALSEGTLIQDPVTGRATGFTPTGSASFLQIHGNDLVIFRVFDITSISGGGDNTLSNVSFIDTRFVMRNGVGSIKPPWDAPQVINGFTRSTSRSLTLTRGAGEDLPCFFQWNNGIVANKILDPDTAAAYLVSFVVQAFVAVSGNSQSAFFRADPEMVVSPDDRPGDGDEDGIPGQSPAMAATSR